jgi:hypothetical protein
MRFCVAHRLENAPYGGTALEVFSPPMGFHSISYAGMKIFDAPIESTIGGIEVDLASAPITPGEHRLELDATIGGIEIYLPSYVTFTIEGSAAIGGQDVHDGLPIWTRMWQKSRSIVGLKNKLPAKAVPHPDPDKPISIHFVIDGGVGGLDIYRL